MVFARGSNHRLQAASYKAISNPWEPALQAIMHIKLSSSPTLLRRTNHNLLYSLSPSWHWLLLFPPDGRY